MGKSRWPVLMIAMPGATMAQVIERAKAAGIPVSKWGREVVERELTNPQHTPLVPPVVPPEDVLVAARLILHSKQTLDAWTFAMRLTRALKQEPVEEEGDETAPQAVWQIVEDLIEQKVLKAEMREGVRYVSLLS